MSEIRRLGGDTNAVIVQLPERLGPGVVLQHDSLHNLLLLSRDARGRIADGDLEEADGVLGEIDKLISGYLWHFDHLGPKG